MSMSSVSRLGLGAVLLAATLLSTASLASDWFPMPLGRQLHFVSEGRPELVFTVGLSQFPIPGHKVLIWENSPLADEVQLWWGEGLDGSVHFGGWQELSHGCWMTHTIGDVVVVPAQPVVGQVWTSPGMDGVHDWCTGYGYDDLTTYSGEVVGTEQITLLLGTYEAILSHACIEMPTFDAWVDGVGPVRLQELGVTYLLSSVSQISATDVATWGQVKSLYR